MSVRQGLARVWHARATSVLVVAAYLGWLSLGLGRGLRDVHDHDLTSPAVLLFAHSKTREIAVQGDAVRTSLRQERRAAFLRGVSTLRVRDASAGTRVLWLQLEFDGVQLGETARLVDRATGRAWTIAGLESRRVEATVPIAGADATFELTPPSDRAGHRWLAVELRAGSAAAAATEPSARVGQATVRLGSGFAGDLSVDGDAGAGRIAHLLVAPDRPGRHRLRLCYRPVAPPVRDVRFLVDGRPVTAAVMNEADWRVAQFDTELAARSVVSVESTGPLLSPRQLGRGANERPIALDLRLARCDIAFLP